MEFSMASGMLVASATDFTVHLSLLHSAGPDSTSLRPFFPGTKKRGEEVRCYVWRSRPRYQAPSTDPGYCGVDEIWQQFFSAPSQWWDNTVGKVNPKYPDFKHKRTGVGLWINGKSNPSWVKTELMSMITRPVSRTLYSWNAIISRCVKSDQGVDALKLYSQMQSEGIKPNAFTFARVLNACASLKALKVGRSVHTQVLESGCESDIFVGSTLVHMYGTCGSIEDAERVFQRMPVRDVVLWNSMLAGYMKCKQGNKVLELFPLMQEEGVKPDPVTYVVVLNACTSILALEQGKLVHAQLMDSGCEPNVFVGSTLVDMYGKCGSIGDAQIVFDRMSTRSVVSWNAMLAGYVKCDQGKEALELFARMHEEQMKPDAFTFVIILNACASIMALDEGRCIHAQIIKSGCESDLFVGNTLVDMYGKCGSIEDAQRVFHKMRTRDVVSWNAMLAGHVKCQAGQKALELFALMNKEGVKADSVTFVVVLNACGSIMALEDGRQVHRQLIQSGCACDVFVGNTLVDMYGKCGSVEDAQHIFDTMPIRSVVSWNAMLAGYVKCEQGEKALELFAVMLEEGLKPDHITFVVVLNACAGLAALEEGRRVHTQLMQSGCLLDVYVGNTLIDMYGKCGSIEDAQRVFHTMGFHNVVSWNAMLAGYVKCEQAHKALQLFRLMQDKGLEPDSVTFVSVLNACGSAIDLKEGRLVHGLIIDSGWDFDVFVGSALVDMYAKCGSIDDAEKIFFRMPTRDVVSWNAMFTGYVKCEQGIKAVELLRLMQEEGVEPDRVTFIAVLNACTSIMGLEEGRRIHAQAIESHWESDVFVGSTLVDMYAKCGSIEDAQRVFYAMPSRDVVSWNAMLGGFAMHGQGKKALKLFKEMQETGVEINSVTFICLLSACSHGGFVEEGVQLFQSMDSVYGILRTVEHYVCMVDLLGRAGRLNEAEGFLRSEPKINQNSVALMALLGACRNHGNVEMGTYSSTDS